MNWTTQKTTKKKAIKQLPEKHIHTERDTKKENLNEKMKLIIPVATKLI